MKKLSLNKKVIAQLDSPENIQGGAEESRNPNCYLIEHEVSGPGIWRLTEKWNCPSNQETYCAIPKCHTYQCAPDSCCCANV